MKLSIMLLATATSVAASAAPLLGQVRFEIAPQYGVFLPTRQAYLNTGTIYQNQSGQVAGLNLTTFLSSRLGFEVSAVREWGAMGMDCRPHPGAFCAFSAPVSRSDLTVGDNRLWLVGANGFLNLPIMRSPLTAVVTLGGGAISRGGRAYSLLEASEGLKFSGLLGLGARVRLWEIGSLRADVQDHVSPCGFAAMSSQDCPTQHDLTLMTGFSVPLMRKHR